MTRKNRKDVSKGQMMYEDDCLVLNNPREIKNLSNDFKKKEKKKNAQKKSTVTPNLAVTEGKV
jgi:hypothetical protein